MAPDVLHFATGGRAGDGPDQGRAAGSSTNPDQAAVPTPNDTALVLDDFFKEIERSVALHPRFPNDLLRGAALMCEEAGEALKAALDATRPGDQPRDVRANNIRFLYAETVQTMATAYKLLMAMRINGYAALTSDK